MMDNWIFIVVGIFAIYIIGKMMLKEFLVDEKNCVCKCHKQCKCDKTTCNDCFCDKLD